MLEVIAEVPPGQTFDEGSGQEVVRIAVGVRPGVFEPLERKVTGRLRHRPGTVVVAFRRVEPLAGAQATAMRQKVADGGLVVRYPGEVARHRCVEVHVAGVDELQHRQSCEGLRDGSHGQRRISGEGPACAVGPREVLGLDRVAGKDTHGQAGPSEAFACLAGQLLRFGACGGSVESRCGARPEQACRECEEEEGEGQ